MLKTPALAGAAYIILSLSPALSQATWCAYRHDQSQYEYCGYYTYNQCLVAVLGVGGSCRPNPYAERDRHVPSAMDDNTGSIHTPEDDD